MSEFGDRLQRLEVQAARAAKPARLLGFGCMQEVLLGRPLREGEYMATDVWWFQTGQWVEHRMRQRATTDRKDLGRVYAYTREDFEGGVFTWPTETLLGHVTRPGGGQMSPTWVPVAPEEEPET